LATVVLPCAFSLLAFAAPSNGQEWTRFRGPDGSGIATPGADIPAKWSDRDFRWKIDLPGVGHSSPVLWGDRVFVTCGDEQTGAPTLVCVNASDGSVRWKRDYTSENYRHHGENSYASSTPAVDAERVYLCLMQPKQLRVVALDHDGKDAWSADLGPFVTQHGGGHSPIVFDDIVVVANDQDGPGSSIVALDRRTGEKKWTSPRKSYRFSASTPCVYRPKDGGPAQLVFTSWAHGITGIDPKTGLVLWELPEAFDARTVGSPVAVNDAGLVIASCGEGPGGHWIMAVKPGSGGAKPDVAYKIARMSPYVPTPIVKGNLLFVWADGGTVTCAMADTGETVWQERVGGTYFGSPVCVGDKLFCVSKRGEVTVIAAADKFQLLARNDLGEKSDATPAVAGGRMYLRTYGKLICVGGAEPAAPGAGASAAR
jgi:outer membrane protein assembly factor BamB